MKTRTIENMIRSRKLLAGLLVVTWLATGEGLGQAQENKWGFGTDVGFLSGTVNDTVFALGFNADYYLDRSFSIGPMLQLAPVGDLTQIAMAGVARYHFRTGAINVVPFAGFGLVHADLDRGSGPGSIDTNDTSYYIPLGVTLEWQVARTLALASTVMVNLYDLNLDPPVGRDHTSVAVMFGFRFGP
ncbi:MAG TPA: hypothetical protein VFL31_01115 [Nitrospiraceae bacterium]|nr:hypothetical protein [Nitrospiraceae bacterium]